MLSIRQLRYALAVWRDRSFLGAAGSLNVSQPAISNQVRQLEIELGFDLFRRTGHGVEVTEVGRNFLIQAELVHFGIVGLTDLARQLRGGPAGSIAVGLSSGIAPLVVREVMESAQTTQSKARLEITTTTTRRINELLLQEKMDVGITAQTNPRALPRELASDTLFQDEMAVIAPPEHRLARKRSVVLEELPEYPMIMNELTVGYGELVLSMFTDRGLSPNIVAISDNVETLKAMVNTGAGIAIVPKLSVVNALYPQYINVLDLRPARLLDVMLVRRLKKMSPMAESYVATLRGKLRAINAGV